MADMVTSSDPHENNRAFYDRISGAYDFIADANEHRAREAGEKALNLQPGEKVLEIGFGTGNSFQHLAEAVGPEGRACGIDISEGMRDVAAKKIREAGLADRTDLQVADARQLPYSDGEFDAAFTTFTLELFPAEDIPIVLSEVRRVLKDDGRLGVVAMSVVGPGERESVLEKTYKWMHQHFPHIVDCRPIDVPQFLESSGFRIESQEHREIWSMPVAVVIGRPGTAQA